jgi:hypothetical protein
VKETGMKANEIGKRRRIPQKVILICCILAVIVAIFAFSIMLTAVINESIESSFAEDIDLEDSITAGEAWTAIPLVMAGKKGFTLEEIANLIERWQGENPHLEILDIDLYYSGGVNRVLYITHRPHEG